MPSLCCFGGFILNGFYRSGDGDLHCEWMRVFYSSSWNVYSDIRLYAVLFLRWKIQFE